MTTNMSAGLLPRTVPVVIAAVLAFCYAAVLIGLAVLLAVDWTSGVGTVGHLTGRVENRGVAMFLVACLAGAAALVTGSVRALRGNRGLGIIIPLGVVTVIGCIGEPLDIASGNPATSNIIGAFILAMAILPIVLLLLPRRRTRR